MSPAPYLFEKDRDIGDIGDIGDTSPVSLLNVFEKDGDIGDIGDIGNILDIGDIRDIGDIMDIVDIRDIVDIGIRSLIGAIIILSMDILSLCPQYPSHQNMQNCRKMTLGTLV